MNVASVLPADAPPKTAAIPDSAFALRLRESRRVAARRHVLLPCQAVRERDFKLIADRTLDVSVEGLLLPVREPVLTGETLIISFPIPGMWIDAEATVTRVIHGRRPSDEGLAIGVLFDVLGPAARAALAGFLHGRPPPLPRRDPLSRPRRREMPPSSPETVDAVGVLRELALAWRKIGVPAVSGGDGDG